MAQSNHNLCICNGGYRNDFNLPTMNMCSKHIREGFGGYYSSPQLGSKILIQVRLGKHQINFVRPIITFHVLHCCFHGRLVCKPLFRFVQAEVIFKVDLVFNAILLFLPICIFLILRKLNNGNFPRHYL